MVEEVRERIELGDANSVRASMLLGSGKLAVRGGAEALMEGVFEFSPADWRPEVTYEISEGAGCLVVKQPEHSRTLAGLKHTSVWDLALGNQVPLELALKLGSGDADLRLADTRAVMLDAAVGSGQVLADLTGAAELRHVTVKVGSGRVNLAFDGVYADLRKVSVNVASGMSDLVLSGDYPKLKELQVSSASGRIGLRIEGAGPELKALALNTASGLVELDLSGALPDDLEVAIRCVSGAATVRVPAGLGMSVRFSSVSGRLHAPGFHRENGRYVNDAHGEGPALHLAMSTVSGVLTLQPIES
jgi:hypothetical protein